MAPPSGSERSNVVTVRLTDEEHELLGKLAERDGLSQSDVLRQLLKTRASEVVKPRKRLVSTLGSSSSPSEMHWMAHRQLAGRTIVHNLATNQPLMQLEGAVILPVGAEIELGSPRVSARVMRVRLLADEPATVCLDVHVPE